MKFKWVGDDVFIPDYKIKMVRDKLYKLSEFSKQFLDEFKPQIEKIKKGET